MPVPFCGQKYATLKKSAVTTGVAFVDDTFKANKSALSMSSISYEQVQWKRPKEIYSTAQFMKEAVCDLSHGDYGNHSFVSACSCLLSNKVYTNKVIPGIAEQEWTSEQDAEKPNYGGVHHFTFWHNGDWLDVVVDDLLPTINGTLIFTQSPIKYDFWCPLLEKAYAKLLGSYEKIVEADMMEILEDFTGGLSEIATVESDEDSQESLFRMLKNEIDNKSLIIAIVCPSMFSMIGAVKVGGLLGGHGYAVTSVKRVTLTGTPLVKLMQQDKVNLIRLRDPWVTTGWTGKFGNSSPEWEQCDSALQKKLGLELNSYNEFWMPFEDFCSTFTDVVICGMMKHMNGVQIHSEWAEPNKAGGSIENTNTFLNNPQIIFTVSGRESEVVMSLMQNLDSVGIEVAESQNTTGLDNMSPTRMSIVDKEWTIQNRSNSQVAGLTVLKVEENRMYRLHRLMEVVKTSEFNNIRSIILRHVFPKGRYVIVATLLEPHQIGTFLFRIYTSSASKAMELKWDKPKEALCKACSCMAICVDPTVVTQVIVVSAAGFHTAKTEPNPYCIIICEGEKVVTPVCKNMSTPLWNTGAVFYRRYHTSQPIKIQLWNRGTLKDTFMGEVVLAARLTVDGEDLDWPFYDRQDSSLRKPGYIRIKLTVSHNMLTV